RARLAAVRGSPDAAALVARVIDSLGNVPYPNIRVDGFIDAAEATAVLGDPATAIRYAEEALRLAEAKGNIPRARQVRAIIARIASSPDPELAQPFGTPGAPA
ncbi:MAG TPA: hypothetical protein VIM24_12915, partial [Candidatus Limnocylindrales bacterium]